MECRCFSETPKRQAPLVSIIVPFYNASKYLPDTLSSVLAQTLDCWELILVDDGSVDTSTAIARAFAVEIPDRVHYLQHDHHRNLGQFACRVAGAEVARADVVALLDSDDVWEPEYLEEHLRIWQGLPESVGLSYGPALFWFSDDSSPRRDYVQGLPAGIPSVFSPGSLLSCFVERNYAFTPCPSASLVRRSIFREVSHWSESAKRSLGYEDQILWWYIAATYPIAVQSRCLVRYRIANPHSSVKETTANRVVAARAELEFLSVISSYLQAHNPQHELLTEGVLAKRMDGLSLQCQGKS